MRQLRQVLENSGVKLTANAPYKLILTNEKETQRAATYSGNGGTVEYQLTNVVSYEVRGQNNLPLLNDRVEAQKVVMEDGSNIAGANQESLLIRKEMRRDLIQQLVMRLEQLTPAKLEKLQELADAKAKAEADAIEAARKAQEETPQQSPLELQNQ